MTPTLETERLTLRKPNGDDWPHVRDFYLSERSSMAGGVMDEGAAWRQLAMMIGHWDLQGFGMFSVLEKGGSQTIGLVGHYFPRPRPEKEIGWVIFEGAEGKSLAHEAAVAVRHHAYETLGWTTAVSYIDKNNTRSIKLAERLGCTLDTAATQPKPNDPCLIYRHPSPSEVRA